MAKPADYWQARDLKNANYGGLINEDVMQKIWDISGIPLPLTDMVAAGSAKSPLVEWVQDKLPSPTLGGWVVDGADLDQNNAAAGTRYGNQCGILVREVQISERADAVDVIGHQRETSRNVTRQLQILKRNVEANLLGTQGSLADNGDTVAGQPAGLACMMKAHDTGSGATGGVYSGGGIWSAISAGTAKALTETMIRDAAQEAWESGGNPSVIMSVPSVIRQLSKYMFGNSAQIATIQRQTGDGGPATAIGSVNVFLTDFGVTLDFVPNRIQLTHKDTTAVTPKDVAEVFVFDPDYVEIAYLKPVHQDELAKTGLTTKTAISVDFSVKLTALDSGRVLHDIDPAQAVAA